jgi:predicted RNA binding protein YcfA (HicA-like mRNA interferase family)
MKVRDIIKRIEEDGWHLTPTRGSHRQYEHPTKKSKVTVPGHPNDDLSPAMISSIFRQAGMPRKGKGD